MQLFIYQLKQAYLSLKQKPGFVASVVSTMGITLGALLCVITLAYVMLVKPLPYPEQDKLYVVEHQLINNHGAVDGRAFTYPNLLQLYAKQAVFSPAALQYVDAAILTSEPSEPMLQIAFVTPAWFALLGSRIALGRAFTDTEQLNSHNPVAIISFDTWQQEFNGSADILNKTLVFNGKSYRVVGVLAKNSAQLSLAGAGYRNQVYLPWDFNSVDEYDRQAWGNDDSGLAFIGKLNANLSVSQVNQQLTQLVNNNWQNKVVNEPFFKDWRINIQANSLKDYLTSDSKQSLYLLLFGALGLVLIAFANIANLIVSRTAERQQQLAICAAVGASPAQLLRTFVSEIGLLMLLSLLVAQGIVLAGFSFIRHYLADYLPRINELALNGFSSSISVGLLILLSLLFSLLVRRMINYRTLSANLHASGKGNGVQVSKRVRNTLISSQITIAMALIFINAMLCKQAITLINQPLGYQTEQTVAAVLSVPELDSAVLNSQMTELKQALLAMPNVKEVSQGMRPSIFRTLAITMLPNNQRFSVSGKDVDHQYFSLIQQSIIEGRNFSAADITDDNPVVIINDIFANTIAPNGSAIGLKFDNGAQVIGVVQHINIPGRISSEPRFYYPAKLGRNMLLIKLKPAQQLSREQLLFAMKNINKQFSLFSLSSLDDYKQQRLFSAKTTAIASLVLTLLTIFLAGIGLYGILSYSTQMRRFELGTRMAIGAKGNDIIRLVVKDNASALLLGIVISVLLLTGLYLGFSDSLASYLSLELIPLFIITLAAISLLSFIACYLPLRQYIYRPAIHSLRGNE